MSKKRAPKSTAPLATPAAEAAIENDASVEAAPDATESERRSKGKKSKRDKKDKHSKKDKKEKAAKAAKPEKKGKKDKSTLASELRPLRKVNVRLIEPNGQPRAYFNGEIGVLDLLLPKAEGDDSGT